MRTILWSRVVKVSNEVGVPPGLVARMPQSITERGVGTHRQPHPKTDRCNLVVALPTFTAKAIRRRLSVMAGRSADALASAPQGDG